MEEKIVGDLDWDGLHRPRIYYAVATTFCGLFLSVLDGSICNVALPSIARELGVSSSDSIWIVNAFQLVIMMTILPFASMGERWGYKQVYLRGVIVFTIGSLFCALSHNLSLLVISRVFQGFGAAMIMSVNTSLIKLIYPKRRLGEGVGLNATVVAIASVAGPTLAAGILSVASWPWLFAINVPVGVVTFFMGRRYLPDNAVRVLGHRFNWKEALLNAATFGLFIGCVEALGGFSKMRFGEDIDFSIRIFKNGYTCRLFPDAWVYHKRRTDLKKFFKQVHNSGIARINLYKKYPDSLKLVHLLPAVFTLGVALLLLGTPFCLFSFTPIILYALLVCIDSTIQNKSLSIGVYSIAAAFIQLIGYGTGFWRAWWQRCIRGKDEFEAFQKNFYK